MLTLYTAVGTLKFQKTTGGKSIPLVINDGQEYGLSDDELLLWSCLAFQILTSMNSRMPIPCARYRKKVRKAYPSNTI